MLTPENVKDRFSPEALEAQFEEKKGQIERLKKRIATGYSEDSDREELYCLYEWCAAYAARFNK